MKLVDVLLLFGSIAFLIIGVDQIMKVGFTNAYWAIMVALILFFVFNLRRRKTK
jgi:hypothetical protein